MSIVDNKNVNKVLLVILLLAACLRGYDITQRGIFDYDEAWYLLEAKTLFNSGRYILANIGVIDDLDATSGLRAYIKDRGTVPMTSIKPGHTILLLLGYLLFGIHDYAGFAISVISGILTVLLVYHLGRRMYNQDVGLIAALVLAVSPLHIVYSRAAFSQANAICLMVLGAYLWYRAHSSENSNPRMLVWCGLAAGGAFICHFNMAWITVGFLSLEFLAINRNREFCSNKKAKLTRLLLLGGAMAIPALAFEIVGQTAKRMGIFPEDYPTYLGQFAHREPLAKAIRFSFEQVPFWTTRIFEVEGILIILCASLGLAVILKRIKHLQLSDCLVITMLLTILLPPSVLSPKGYYFMLRNYAAISPSLALLTALGLSWAIRRPRLSSVPVAAALSLVLVAAGIHGVSDLLPVRSTYRQATQGLISYLDQFGGTVNTRPPSSWPIWYFYLSEAYDSNSPGIRNQIKFYPKETQEGDFELFDVKRYYRGVTNSESQHLKQYAQIRTHARPVLSLQNPASKLPRRFYEAASADTEAAFERLERDFPESARIEIFDLRTKAFSMSPPPNAKEEHHE